MSFIIFAFGFVVIAIVGLHLAISNAIENVSLSRGLARLALPALALLLWGVYWIR